MVLPDLVMVLNCVHKSKIKIRTVKLLTLIFWVGERSTRSKQPAKTSSALGQEFDNWDKLERVLGMFMTSLSPKE